MLKSSYWSESYLSDTSRLTVSVCLVKLDHLVSHFVCYIWMISLWYLDKTHLKTTIIWSYDFGKGFPTWERNKSKSISIVFKQRLYERGTSMFGWALDNIRIEKDFKISWIAWASFWIRFKFIQLFYA